MTFELGRHGDRMSQRRKLGLWLAEWQAFTAMAAVPLADRSEMAGRAVANAKGGGRAAESAEGKVLDVGQVRLLRPCVVDMNRTRPVYVAVLRQMGGASWMVAPLSRFANPAIPGELRTCLRALPLRVLCVWNARIVNQEALATSWLCRETAVALVARGLRVWRHISEGAALDREMVPRVGPPLEHPLDPRHEYLQEEMALLDAHLGFAVPNAARDSGILYAIPESGLRKAAEPRGEYGKDGGV